MPSRANQLTPQTRQRILYSDFMPNLDCNPRTGELQILTNEQAVINAIRNLVLIYPTEIPYHPNFGSTVTQSLFEFVDEFTADRLKDSITQSISQHEPRASNLNVKVTGDAPNHLYNIDIAFNLVNNPIPFTVPTIVVKVR